MEITLTDKWWKIHQQSIKYKIEVQKIAQEIYRSITITIKT